MGNGKMIEWEKYLSADKEVAYLNELELTSFSWKNCSMQSIESHLPCKCPNSIRYIHLNGNRLASFTWENCPNSVEYVNLNSNRLISFSWEKCPNSIRSVYLEGNLLTSFSWEKCPNSIKSICLTWNRLTTFSWENCPNTIEDIDLSYNQLSSFSWEKCPKSIKFVYLSGNEISEIVGNTPKDCKVIGLKKVINWETFEVINEECGICHENGEVVKLKCFETHLYHKECLDNWFSVSANRNCPMCQKII